MPDILEPVEHGNYYHIYNHAIGNENLFVCNDNYLYFLTLLKKHLVPYSKILSYNLMPNHFHLLLRFHDIGMPDGIAKNYNCSIQLSKLFNAYSQAYNKKYHRRGSLFIHKFRRKKVTNEFFLRNLILYINNNSVHHGFSNKAHEWAHSSFASITSSKPTLLDRDFVLSLFDDVENFVFCLNKDFELDNSYTFE